MLSAVSNQPKRLNNRPTVSGLRNKLARHWIHEAREIHNSRLYQGSGNTSHKFLQPRPALISNRRAFASVLAAHPKPASSTPPQGMEAKTANIPGLSPTEAESTSTVPKSHVPGKAVSLEEWLKSQPSTVPSAPQQKKKGKPTPTIMPMAVDPNDKVNWVGKLHEYWASLAAKQPGTIDEGQLDLPPPHLYYCTVTYSLRTFGGPSFPFVSKKHAKQHAAEQAVLWLIEEGYVAKEYIYPETSLKVRAKPSAPPGPPIEDQSYAARVHYLAPTLGYTSPVYVIELNGPDSVALYNGYAHFPNEPEIEGRVGEFRNIWGKKNAKETCAKGVWEFLKGIERMEHSGCVESEEVEGSIVSNTSKRKMGHSESPEARQMDKTKVAKSCAVEGGEDEDDIMSEYWTPRSS